MKIKTIIKLDNLVTKPYGLSRLLLVCGVEEIYVVFRGWRLVPQVQYTPLTRNEALKILSERRASSDK